MTDIVERAHHFTWSEPLVPLLKELATEIEQLRSYADKSYGARMHKLVAGKEAEIERLRAAYDSRGAEMETMREVLATTQNWNEERVAEIERLKGERASDQQRLFNYEAEIARLQAVVVKTEADCKIVCDSYANENQQFHDEIKRLQDEVRRYRIVVGPPEIELVTEIERLHHECDALRRAVATPQVRPEGQGVGRQPPAQENAPAATPEGQE
jgi:chromosome segregation ATPase